MAEVKFKVTNRLNDHQFLAVIEFEGATPADLLSMPVTSQDSDSLITRTFTATLPDASKEIQTTATTHQTMYASMNEDNTQRSRPAHLPANPATTSSGQTTCGHISMVLPTVIQTGWLKGTTDSFEDCDNLTSTQDKSLRDVQDVDVNDSEEENPDSDFTELDLSQYTTASQDQELPMSGSSTVAFTDKTAETDIARLMDVHSETSVDQALSPIVCIQSSVLVISPPHDSAIGTGSLPLSSLSVPSSDKTLRSRSQDSAIETGSLPFPSISVPSAVTPPRSSLQFHFSTPEASSPPAPMTPKSNVQMSPDCKASTSRVDSQYRAEIKPPSSQNSITDTVPRKTNPIANLVPGSQNWQWPVCGRLLNRTDILMSQKGCPFFKGKLEEFDDAAPASAIVVVCFGTDTEIYDSKLHTGGVYYIYDAEVKRQNPRFDRNTGHKFEMVLRANSGTVVETRIEAPRITDTMDELVCVDLIGDKSPPSLERGTCMDKSPSGSDFDDSDEIIKTASTKKRHRIVTSDDDSDEESSAIPVIKRTRSMTKASKRPGRQVKMSREKSTIDIDADSMDGFLVKDGDNDSEDDEYMPDSQELMDCYIVDKQAANSNKKTRGGKKNLNLAHKRSLFDEKETQPKRKKQMSRIKPVPDSSLESNAAEVSDESDSCDDDDNRGENNGGENNDTSDNDGDGTGDSSSASHSDSDSDSNTSNSSSGSSSSADDRPGNNLLGNQGLFGNHGLANHGPGNNRLGNNGLDIEGLGIRRKCLTKEEKNDLGSELNFFGFFSLTDMMLADILEPGCMENMYSDTQNAETKTIQARIFALQGLVTSRLALCFSQAWCKLFKDAVETCPNVTAVRDRSECFGIEDLEDCQACNRQRRPWSKELMFNGHPYDKTTFQRLLEEDEDDDEDDDGESFNFLVGCYCAKRSRIYHTLFHWQYKLYQDCKAKMEEVRPRFPANATTEQLVKACVKDKNLWLTKYDILKTLLHEADQDFSADARMFQF